MCISGCFRVVGLYVDLWCGHIMDLRTFLRWKRLLGLLVCCNIAFAMVGVLGCLINMVNVTVVMRISFMSSCPVVFLTWLIWQKVRSWAAGLAEARSVAAGASFSPASRFE